MRAFVCKGYTQFPEDFSTIDVFYIVLYLMKNVIFYLKWGRFIGLSFIARQQSINMSSWIICHMDVIFKHHCNGSKSDAITRKTAVQITNENHCIIYLGNQ